MINIFDEYETSLRANQSFENLRERDKLFAKKTKHLEPDLSKSKYVLKIGKTVYFPKTLKRFEALKKQYNIK